MPAAFADSRPRRGQFGPSCVLGRRSPRAGAWDASSSLPECPASALFFRAMLSGEVAGRLRGGCGEVA
eukprot:6394372-Alexandrium_andersonii.AAC.1